jgi:hypothetical protein
MTNIDYSIHLPTFNDDEQRADYYAYYAQSLLESALYNVQDYQYGNDNVWYGYDAGMWLDHKLDYLQIKKGTPYTGAISAQHNNLHRMVNAYIKACVNYYTIYNLDKHREVYRKVKAHHTAIKDAFVAYCESTGVSQTQEHASNYIDWRIYMYEHDNGKLYDTIIEHYEQAKCLCQTYDAQIDVNIINTFHELYAASCTYPYTYKLFADHAHAAIFDAIAYALRASGELLLRDISQMYACNKGLRWIEIDANVQYDNASANRYQELVFVRVKLALHSMFYALHHDDSLYMPFQTYMHKAMDNLYIKYKNYHSNMVIKMQDMYVHLIEKRDTMNKAYERMTQTYIHTFENCENAKQAYSYQIPHGLGKNVVGYMAMLQAHAGITSVAFTQHNVHMLTDTIQEYYETLRDYSVFLHRYDYCQKMNKIALDSMQHLTDNQYK